MAPTSGNPYQPGGRVYSSGVVVGPRTRRGDPSNYRQPTTAAQAERNRAAQEAMRTAARLGLTPADAHTYNTYVNSSSSSQNNTPRRAGSGGSSGSGGRGGGYGGGGGGGGGGVNAAKQAQTSMDMITQLLASGMYTAPKLTGERDALAAATRNDLGAVDTSYNALDAWLNSNQADPYANLQFQQAQVAPDQNAFLTSQGGEAQPLQTRNPNDGYGGFANAAALMSANQRSGNTSRLAESQMARAGSTTGINAMDNAMQAGISQRETAAQQALDTEKRQTIAQLIELIAQGVKAPDLTRLGVYAPGGNAQDPHGWAAIDAAMRAAGQR